jgi:suppressor of ftsI
MMGDGSMMMGNMGGSSNGGAHMMPDGTMMGGGQAMGGHTDDIEWEDTMSMMNSMSTEDTAKWKITDQDTGASNHEINWAFTRGEKVKITVFNDPKGMHVMQHPLHFHGQRFVVLSTNGKQNTNMVWKDTTLVKAGDTVDILLEISNPGDWMAHCHVAEHLSDGMMINFTVK